MAITLPRFSGNSSTRLWDHLNNLATDLETLLNPEIGNDTGWVTIPFAAGGEFVLLKDNPIQVRRLGKHVFLRGDCRRVAGGINDNQWHTVCTLPAQYRPSLFLRPGAGGSAHTGSTGVIGVDISGAGVVSVGRIAGPSGPTNPNICFGGISWVVG